MIYVVIDTNVFVSALMTQNPNSATTKVVDHLAKGDIILLYNDEILSEYQSVLSRDRFHITSTRVAALINFIRQKGVAAERVSADTLFTDESDRVFYEVALSEEDSFLVTGNLRHFPADTRVMTPAQMLDILAKG